MVDLLIIFSLIVAGCAVILFAAGMLVDCAVAAAVWVALVAAVVLVVRRERTPR